METKNLGVVKSIFVQSTSPVRTDVWWYDTINNVLKYWDIVSTRWTNAINPIVLYAVTDGAPTKSEITAAMGVTPVVAGAGYRRTIKDTSGTGLLYFIESDGTDWFYSVTTKAT
jgi:hypothetical protein